ncbi:hypothetical protein ZHAS_00020316 [Anopheles sinensis]|uniref:Uncharacterized protein n=1 Tax=Anopheles sinensis TaxID=74873 RepID=A0A084WPR4_ANOSI|nr:hypothetical protein ZHAS_00020316 [Anopheles sinensis]
MTSILVCAGFVRKVASAQFINPWPLLDVASARASLHLGIPKPASRSRRHPDWQNPGVVVGGGGGGGTFSITKP